MRIPRGTVMDMDVVIDMFETINNGGRPEQFDQAEAAIIEVRGVLDSFDPDDPADENILAVAVAIRAKFDPDFVAFMLATAIVATQPERS